MTAALRAFAMQPVLQELIAQVHGVVYQPHATEHVAMRVAHVLRPFMGAPGLLSAEQSEPDLTQYRQHMLYIDPQDRFSIVALVWMPGQQTPIHDHVAWCVFGVHQGTEYEVNYRLCHGPEGDFLVPVGGSTNEQGSVAALIPPGDIHHVFNRGCGPAISLHVYGANISTSKSSILRRYELPILPSMEELAELPASAPLPHVAVQAHPWARVETSALWL